ncbi:MAG TPA: phospholipase D-like domain-containing protein [Kofleriaceae bacterium]|jgi:cardiolipin synthase
MLSWSALGAHHAMSVITFLLALALATSVLRSRRPASTSTAWLLALVLVPYFSIPLYLVFGERKLWRARGKAPVPPSGPREKTTEPADLVWLDSPKSAFDAFLARIAGAERSIHISTFLLGDDPTGRAILAALAERARANVQVCLLIDGLWVRSSPHRGLRDLRAAGGEVRVFLPLLHLPWHGRSNVRNHRKIAVFDDDIAISGGMNLSDDYLATGAWRDLSIEVSGPTARELHRVFEADWRFAGGTPHELPDEQCADPSIEVIPTGPDSAGDAWHDALLQLIFDARSRVWIATPYFVPDETLLRALEIAQRRGVDVRIVVPARSNHWIPDRVAAPLLRELAAVGVTLMRYQPGMLHAKCLIVDASIAAVGSANFNTRSMFLDFEVMTLLRTAAANARLTRWFEATFADCAPGPALEGGLLRSIESVLRLLAPIS